MSTGFRQRLLLVALAAIGLPASANAQVALSGHQLTLDLAMEAASEAARSCAAHGWAVSASVVNADGVVKVQAKGDHSTIHTQDSSFRKAYTVITMGPIFGFDTTSEFVKKAAGNPSAPALVTLPNILLLAGGVAIRIDGEMVAAIGVGGAPGGDKDEACAMDGVRKIASRLTSQ